MTCAIQVLEIAISFKFVKDAGNIQDDPWPLYKTIPWAAFSILIAGFYLYLRLKKDRTTKYPKSYVPRSLK